MIFSNAAHPKLSLHPAATKDTEVSLNIMLVSLEGQKYMWHILALEWPEFAQARGRQWPAGPYSNGDDLSLLGRVLQVWCQRDVL